MIEIAHAGKKQHKGRPAQRCSSQAPSAESQLANRSPNAQWTAQMADVLNAGTVQRVIMVDKQQYTAKQAAEALFIKRLIDIKEVDDYEKILVRFDDNGDTFDSLEEL